MLSATIRGVVAGAAATSALNAVTYMDMVVRGRPPSRLPEDAVEQLSSVTHTEIPGVGEARRNRIGAIGSLSGIATGVLIGAIVSPILESKPVQRLPASMAALIAGGAAMGAANGPMARLGVSSPGSWSVSDWLSDAVPHLAYGATLVAASRLISHRLLF
jgi:hypothetical protein